MLSIITGFLSGIISGMGIGGGAILIPALIFFQNVSQQTAQGINLVYFLPTAVISLFVHIRNKNVELKTAAIIGACGVLGAAGGAFITTFLSGGMLRKLFGIFLFFIGFYEVCKGVKMKSNKNTVS